MMLSFVSKVFFGLNDCQISVSSKTSSSSSSSSIGTESNFTQMKRKSEANQPPHSSFHLKEH